MRKLRPPAQAVLGLLLVLCLSACSRTADAPRVHVDRNAENAWNERIGPALEVLDDVTLPDVVRGEQAAVTQCSVDSGSLNQATAGRWWDVRDAEAPRISRSLWNAFLALEDALTGAGWSVSGRELAIRDAQPAPNYDTVTLASKEHVGVSIVLQVAPEFLRAVVASPRAAFCTLR